MKPYIVKFNYVSESDRGKMNSEEMFLCLHADDLRDAREKYVQVTGGESRQNFLVSIKTPGPLEIVTQEPGK